LDVGNLVGQAEILAVHRLSSRLRKNA